MSPEDRTVLTLGQQVHGGFRPLGPAGRLGGAAAVTATEWPGRGAGPRALPGSAPGPPPQGSGH